MLVQAQRRKPRRKWCR